MLISILFQIVAHKVMSASQSRLLSPLFSPPGISSQDEGVMSDRKSFTSPVLNPSLVLTYSDDDDSDETAKMDLAGYYQGLTNNMDAAIRYNNEALKLYRKYPLLGVWLPSLPEYKDRTLDELITKINLWKEEHPEDLDKPYDNEMREKINAWWSISSISK